MTPNRQYAIISCLRQRRGARHDGTDRDPAQRLQNQECSASDHDPWHQGSGGSVTGTLPQISWRGVRRFYGSSLVMAFVVFAVKTVAALAK